MSDSHTHDFVIQKHGRSFDVKDHRVAITKKKEDSSEDLDFSKEVTVTASSAARSRTLSSHEISDSNSDSDDSTKKTIPTSTRSPKKHKRRHKSIKITSTKNNKYEIPTTTRKKKKRVGNKRHHHRQKNKEDDEKDDKSYETGATGLPDNGSHQILHKQTHNSTKPKPRHEHEHYHNPRSKLKNVKRFELSDSSELSFPSSPSKKPIFRMRKTHNKTAYRAKEKARSPRQNKPRSSGIGKFFENVIKYISPKEIPIYTGLRMPNISVIPSSQWFEYLKNKSKSVAENEKPQNWLEQVETIKNITETVVGELENASLAIQQQMQEVLQPQMQEELQQQLVNKTEDEIDKYITNTQDEIDKHINTSLQIKEQINNLANQTGNLTEILNATANLWQPWIHDVQDDAKVNGFIRHIPTHYSKLFRSLERKTTDENWKHVLKKIERVFKNKFNEYITETTHNKIKTRTGTERVVLNSIGVSNRILRRLFNYVLGDTNNKVFLRNNDTIDIIDKEIKKQTHNELHRACQKLQICRSSRGFASYIIDILTILCSSDNNKFEGAFASLSKVVKKIKFADMVGEDVERGIQQKVVQYDQIHMVYKRSMVAIVKNIIANRNSPLIVYGDSQVDQINKTMALLEIINTLDENVPGNLENLQEWNTVKNNLLNYCTNEEADDIDTTTTALITNILKVISELDEKSQVHVVQNAKTIFIYSPSNDD